MKISERFWDLMARSTLTSAVIASVLVLAACYMWTSGMEVPNQMYNLLYAVVAFFFVSKTAAEARGHPVSEVKQNEEAV